MPDIQTLSLWKNHYLFSALEETEQQKIARTLRTMQLDAGEYLFYQGQEANQFYMVQEGQVKLTRLTPDGNEKVIEILMPGQTFAEAVMFMSREEYPVSASAIVPARVIAFQNQVFMDILRHNNEACIGLLGDVCTRLHSRLQEIESLTMKNATYRVVRYFLNEWEQHPNRQQRVELQTQKQLLASRLSIKPETLSRILSTLKEQGIIESQGKDITIIDVGRLKAYE